MNEWEILLVNIFVFLYCSPIVRLEESLGRFSDKANWKIFSNLDTSSERESFSFLFFNKYGI